MMRFCLLCLFCCLTVQLSAQPAADNRSTLTIPQIMKGERFVGYLPTNIDWSPDSRHLSFSWNPDGDTLRHLYRTTTEGTTPVRLSLEELRSLPEIGTYNRDRSRMVYSKNGDLFLWQAADNSSRQITNTVDRESNPVFSGDEQSIVYRSGDDLYQWRIDDGQLTQLTNFREGNERRTPKPSEQRRWLEEQQRTLSSVLAERQAVSDVRKRRDSLLEVHRPQAIYYGKKRISQLTISPNLRYVSYRLTTPAEGNNTEYADFVTESGYMTARQARSKVGDQQDTYESAIYDRERDTVYNINIDDIPGIRQKPAYLREYHQGPEPYEEEYKSPREVIIHGPFFAEDGKAVVVIRSMDNKDRWIMRLDPTTGKLSLLDRQHDEAWINGPGIVGWNFAAGTIGWLPDNRRIYYQSEASGYSHLYVQDVISGEKKQLTSGDFEILDVTLSQDGQTFFITANAEGPHEHHFYHLPVAGGRLQQITGQRGGHEITVSPDEQHLAVRFSTSNDPWELYIMDNRPGAEMVKVTESTTEDFQTYDWRQPEIVYFEAGDGAQVPARLYRPNNAPDDGPAVIFVHGAGYLQNVHQWWSSYYREYMFHNFLVDNGYTVLDIDYRGSAGYGRDWRTGIYRHMGGKDLSDQIDGARYLVEEHDIDPERIGIYGGSYGGFITLMALFTSPGTFQSGAALRSVTDWAHYNHPYTSNILNTPVTDSIAYQRSSPINFAEGLEDQLLILHGMVDDNVQFQDVVRLAQRLIELGKDNWEFAVFPVEAHGFVEPSSWTDEYKRIYRLFEQTLK